MEYNRKLQRDEMENYYSQTDKFILNIEVRNNVLSAVSLMVTEFQEIGNVYFGLEAEYHI